MSAKYPGDGYCGDCGVPLAPPRTYWCPECDPEESTSDLADAIAAAMWKHHPRRDECPTFGTSIEFWSQDELRQRIVFALDEAKCRLLPLGDRDGGAR